MGWQPKYRPDELIGRSVGSLVPEGFRDRHEQHLARYVEEPRARGMGTGLDLFGRGKDGTEFPVDIRLAPISTSQSVRFLAAVRDMTARRRAEEACRASSEEQFRSAFEHSPIGMALFDLEGRLYEPNLALSELLGYSEQELLGYSEQELIGRTYRDDTHPDDLEDSSRFYEQLRSGQDVAQLEKRFVRADGGVVWALVRVSVVRDAAGRRDHYIAQAVDITDYKRAEEALTASLDELKLAHAELEQFAYAASHDLAEPLRAVAMCVQLLERRYRGRLDEEADEFIELGATGTKRMRRLLDDLLDYARAGGSDRPLAHVDLGRWCRASWRS